MRHEVHDISSLFIVSWFRAFQSFGGFTSGIGVHYAPSAIVNTNHQSHASNLVIGQRVLPHVFTRAADGRPYELQDLLPADTRFKILVFAGDTTNKDQMQRVNALAEEFVHPNNFYAQFGGEEPSTMFDVLTICSAKKDQVNYTDLPAIFRTHWSKYVYPSLLS